MSLYSSTRRYFPVTRIGEHQRVQVCAFPTRDAIERVNSPLTSARCKDGDGKLFSACRRGNKKSGRADVWQREAGPMRTQCIMASSDGADIYVSRRKGAAARPLGRSEMYCFRILSASCPFVPRLPPLLPSTPSLASGPLGWKLAGNATENALGRDPALAERSTRIILEFARSYHPDRKPPRVHGFRRA